MNELLDYTWEPLDEELNAINFVGNLVRDLWNEVVKFGDDYRGKTGKFPLLGVLYPIFRERKEYRVLPSGIAYAVLREIDYNYSLFIRALMRRDDHPDSFLPTIIPIDIFPKIPVNSSSLRQGNGLLKVSLSKVVYAETGIKFFQFPYTRTNKVRFCLIRRLDDGRFQVSAWG